MLRSRLALWLSIFLFPPLGLVLLWARGDLGVLRRIAGTLGIVIIAILELFFVYGMRVVWNGTFSPTTVTFDTRARQYARLEESRERQRAERAVAALPVQTPAIVQPASYWTDFRGPNRAGVYTETEIDTAWPAAGLPRLWKQPVGGGYASFTVGEGRAYTIEQRRDKEAVTAYDVQTGRELWAFTYPALFDEVLGGAGPRATPVYHDGLIYALGREWRFALPQRQDRHAEMVEEYSGRQRGQEHSLGDVRFTADRGREGDCDSRRRRWQEPRGVQPSDRRAASGAR